MDVPTLIPPVPYGNNLTATIPSMASDSRLVVQYSLVDATANTPITWATYTSSTRTLRLAVTDESLEGTYNVKIKASFLYDSTNFVYGQTFDVKLTNKCRTTVITPSSFNPSEPLYYQVGEPSPVLFLFPDWTHPYTTADCGDMVYTLNLLSGHETAITVT